MATEETKINGDTVFTDMANRISRLEHSHNDLLMKHYQFDKELSGLRIDLKYIREGTDKTAGGIQKLLYGIAAVFITYVGGFILSGGLVTGTP